MSLKVKYTAQMRKIFILFILLGCWTSGQAVRYFLISPQQILIGENQLIQLKTAESFESVARRFNVPYTTLRKSNEHIKSNIIPKQVHLLIPSQTRLPALRTGIVIDISMLRLFYFAPDNTVYIFPITVGKLGHLTPLGQYHIISKIKNPTWHPTTNIKKMRAQQGLNTLNSYPPGPNNPLGAYALRLNNQTYLIHGTNSPKSIGKYASAGCIRMYPEDIQTLFELVNEGTSVQIIL